MRENSDDLVIEVSKKALQKAAVDLKAAITELTRLKAVGPATASGLHHIVSECEWHALSDASSRAVCWCT